MNKKKNTLLPVPVTGGLVYDFETDIPEGKWNDLITDAQEILDIIETSGNFKLISGKVQNLGRKEQRSFSTNIDLIERPIQDAINRVRDKGGDGPKNMAELFKFLRENQPKKLVKGPWIVQLFVRWFGNIQAYGLGRIEAKHKSIKTTIADILKILQKHLDRQDKNLIQIQELFGDVGKFQIDLICAGFVIWIVDNRIKQLTEEAGKDSTKGMMMKNVLSGSHRRLLDIIQTIRMNADHMANILNNAESLALQINNLDRTITLAAPMFTIQLATQVVQADLEMAQESESTVLEYIGDAQVQSAQDAYDQAAKAVERASEPGVQIAKLEASNELIMKTIELHDKAVDIIIENSEKNTSILSAQAKTIRKSNMDRLQADPFAEGIREESDTDTKTETE